jgi:hypothetical protein
MTSATLQLYLVLLGIATGILPVFAQGPATGLTSVLRESDDAPGRIHHCQSGPWGQVEYVRSVIEAPEQLVASALPPHAGNRWYLGALSPTAAPPLLAQAGLDAPTLAALLATATATESNGTWTLNPSDEWILALAPEQRNRLYGLLGRFPGNDLMRYPHRFEAKQPDAWFADRSLPAETRALLAGLVYQRGELALFSDVGPALRKVVPAQRQAVMQTLHRQPTLIARLRVDAGDDVPALVGYWGEGGRAAEVAPLLESVQNSRVSWTINIALLLPSWPRQMLLKYDLATHGAFRDCHWTSMNFFSAEPEDRFLDPLATRDEVIRHYARVRENFRLGDLILLRDARGQVVHSCNYVADNLVFTKNGGEAATPWTLMALEELVDYYALGEPLDVVFLRRQE